MSHTDHLEISFDGKKAKFTYFDDALFKEAKRLGTFVDHEILRKSLDFINLDSVVVDCGACYGNHTIFWAQRCKKVYSIEPCPISNILLKRNIEINDLKNVVIYDSVLFDKESNFKRVVKKAPSNVQKMDYIGATKFVESSEGEFKSTTLDSLIKEKIDVLKIDVEGAEIQLLNGCKRIIDQYHPVIFIEAHCGYEFPNAPKNVVFFIQNMLLPWKYWPGKDLFIEKRGEGFQRGGRMFLYPKP